MVIDKSFELPMRGAQAFWRDKIQMSAGEFALLSEEAKLRSFAVSGIAKGDELNTVFKAMQRAIDDGTTFEQFKKDCKNIFERRGWTGKRTWRVDNIFRTNMQTAYNVGRYEQLQEEKDILPYWMYDAINDTATRDTHFAMDGRVYPADHPVWNTWYPPNGYRCRCSVSGLTPGQVESRGLKIEKEDPTDKPMEVVDPETGNKLSIVQMIPETGFDVNPGQMYWQQTEKLIRKRLQNYPPELAAMVEAELMPVIKETIKNAENGPN